MVTWCRFRFGARGRGDQIICGILLLLFGFTEIFTYARAAGRARQGNRAFFLLPRLLIANRGEIAVARHPHRRRPRASARVAVDSDADAGASPCGRGGPGRRIGAAPAAGALPCPSSGSSRRPGRAARTRFIPATAFCPRPPRFAAACAGGRTDLHRSAGGRDPPAWARRRDPSAHGRGRGIPWSPATKARDRATPPFSGGGYGRLSAEVKVAAGRRRAWDARRVRTRRASTGARQRGAARRRPPSATAACCSRRLSSAVRAMSRCRSSATAGNVVHLFERDCSVQRRTRR